MAGRQRDRRRFAPGRGLRGALRVVLDELPDLPYLPELPARGPGADMIGRGAALLVDLHVDVQPSGWRFVDRPGLDQRRAPSLPRPGPGRAGGAGRRVRAAR